MNWFKWLFYNKYRCVHCNKRTKYDSTKQWVLSYCCDRVVHLMRLK